MAPASTMVSHVAFTVLLCGLFATSVLAQTGTGSVATPTVNGTYTVPTATGTSSTSVPSNLVTGAASNLDPLNQILILAFGGVFATFAFGL